MKKNLKQALVPLAVMVFGAAAAFATNAIKQSDAKLTTVRGYHYDSSKPPGTQCVMNLDVWCSTVQTLEICTDQDSNVLRDIDGLSCPDELYKVF